MESSPKILDPIAQFTWHFVNGRSWPVTLIIGDNWVTATDITTYIVNSDDTATYDQVKAMLAEADGIGQWYPNK